MNHEHPKQETIIYGGAFNPPTRAHHAILQACVEYAEPRGADVWLLPSGNRTDKTIEVSTERRLAMLHALTRDIMARTVTVAIEDSELYREATVETYDTVMEMEDRYPERAMTWVFGADSIASMHTWKHGESLRTGLRMLAVDREGAPQVAYDENISRLEIPHMTVSSTKVRTRLESGLSVEDLVTPTVAAYLQS